MEVIALRGPRITTAQRVQTGRLIRLFEQRSDGWYEDPTGSPHDDGSSDWVKVNAGLSSRLTALAAAPRTAN